MKNETSMLADDTRIAIFKKKEIRKILHEGEWWFSVVDIVEALTESPDSGAYWRKLKQRLIEEGSEVVTFCHGLKLRAPDGKMRETDCADIEGYVIELSRKIRQLLSVIPEKLGIQVSLA